MRVRIARPRRQQTQTRRAMLDQKRPDAELGREAFCQFVVRLHGALEAAQPALGDDVRVRQIEERRQAVAFRCRQLRPQRGNQQRSHIIEVGWQLTR